MLNRSLSLVAVWTLVLNEGPVEALLMGVGPETWGFEAERFRDTGVRVTAADLFSVEFILVDAWLLSRYRRYQPLALDESSLGISSVLTEYFCARVIELAFWGALIFGH